MDANDIECVKILHNKFKGQIESQAIFGEWQDDLQ